VKTAIVFVSAVFAWWAMSTERLATAAMPILRIVALLALLTTTRFSFDRRGRPTKVLPAPYGLRHRVRGRTRGPQVPGPDRDYVQQSELRHVGVTRQTY